MIKITTTSRLLLVGTTRAPSKEVMQKIRGLVKKLPNPNIVIVPNPFFGPDEKLSQFLGAQKAYRQGGITVERPAPLEEIPELASRADAPMLLLGGGCPYTLLDEIRRLKLENALREIARKSLLIGACAGGIALGKGTAPACFVDQSTGNTRGIDPSRKREIEGMGLAPFYFISSSSNPRNPAFKVTDLMPLYLNLSLLSSDVLAAVDGAGIYIKRDDAGGLRQEFLNAILRFQQLPPSDSLISSGMGGGGDLQ